jgi:alkanesulfonate monooxygenase SsuD/methylene tetrahydromethanopterin reductase-like flavin-dependent oxidoreductase (luciferase family)
MPAPKLGYLCLSENPSAEYGRALVRQFVLVREADRMGYDDIWIGEQHDDPVWPQGAATVLLGHLAAASGKARIGSLPLLPSLRDLPQLAEDLATLDLLSKGRLQLGVASGRAFPMQLAARGLAPDQAGAALRQRLGQLLPRLQAARTPGAAAETTIPQPQQQPLPVWLAADDEASLRLAAEQGWGLVAAATHTRERVQRMVRLYQETAGRAPELVLARFACSADDAATAQATAEPYLAALCARLQAAGHGRDARRSLLADAQALRSESLVGDHAEVARRFLALADSHGATRIAIVPTSGQFDTHKHILAAFVDEVRPLLDDA